MKIAGRCSTIVIVVDGERDSVRLPVELRHKFRVRSAGTALSVWLGSRLDPGESRWLAKAVVDKATPTRSGALALYIDVREFRPAPPDSLDSIRLWLTHLAQRLTPLGVMVGSASVGSLQFSRLTREAGIADALVGFESVEAAAATWAAICERVAELERADPARPRSTPPASRADRRRCYRVADEA